MLPNIAIAVSGGGYRACLNGGGAVQAVDSRESNSTADGHLGGLLQSATYLAGLSGGGWLVGSIYVNNFTTVSGLLNNGNSSSLWQFQNSIFQGPATGGIQPLDTAEYYSTIYDEVKGKNDAVGSNVYFDGLLGTSLVVPVDKCHGRRTELHMVIDSGRCRFFARTNSYAPSCNEYSSFKPASNLQQHHSLRILPLGS